MSASNNEISDGKNQHSCFGEGMGKAKQVVMHRFTKAKKKLHNCKFKNKRVLRLTSSGNKSRTSGKTIRRGRGGCGTGCYFCFKRPQVLESFSGSPTSNPNDPNYNHLIEKNDFFSRECNPHVD